MEPTQLPPSPLLPVAPMVPREVGRRHIPGLLNWILGAIVSFVLFAVLFPPGSRIQMKGQQTKSLAQAKQIGLALRQYAADHSGNYPRAGQPEMLGAKPADANAAFAVLFPDYATSESIFANPLSAYQTRRPDNVFDQPYTGHPVKTLEPGENVYAYVTGLNNEDDPRTPLVVDGTNGRGCYVTDPKKRGGVWKGVKAVVIHLDDSGALENLRGPADARYVPRHPDPSQAASIRPAQPRENLLDFSGFGPDVRLLDPAVNPR